MEQAGGQTMNLIRALVYRYRRLRYRERPLPRIDVQAGWLVAAWIVRLVAAVLIGMCSGLAASRTVLPWQVDTFLIAALGLWTLIRPGYEVALTTICLAGGLLLIANHGDVGAFAGGIVLAGYLALRLAMIAALLPWRASVAPAAVITWRDGVIVAVTGVIWAVAALPGAGRWPVVVGLIAIVVVALVTSALTRSRDSQ